MGGFVPRGGAGFQANAPITSLFNHAHDAANGFSRMNDGYVSTTSSIDAAMGCIRDHHGGDGYVYAIAAADTSQSGSPLSPILEILLGDFRDDLFNGLGEGMQDLQGALIGNLTLRLGVRDTYSLFVRNICEGDYPSESAGSALEFDDCISYEDKSAGLRRIAASIPSTFALGPANVSIPLVEAVIDAGLGLALCYRGCKGAPCAARRLCPCDGNVGCCVNLDRDTGTAAVVVTIALILIGSSALKEVGVGVGLEIRRGEAFWG
ncbi:heat-labile enterotoxin IIB [Verticillium dahliae VdLs.17]|uniref:Heat-labile enterotoxin IIB n=1 Tax=Verticillium dahliae (strain VdLs.17 / ATCC MYA-4575 / FGSC 10137) TaxID=498257 RepID=G2WV39_VERDV|nr:heat-labile enterotoxin IIB [Verticillium dahliae VdLs.17]EGY20164.1 heat-labile enterotoxin IIB [Verticillium dahliae VdLs.17]KAH6690041.1 heat-labile enterotoxin IIB [Verticillium dahliae]